MTIIEKQLYIADGGEQVFMGFLHSVLSVSNCAYGYIPVKDSLVKNVTARYDYLQRSDFDDYSEFLLNSDLSDSDNNASEAPGRRNLGVEFVSINLFEKKFLY